MLTSSIIAAKTTPTGTKCRHRERCWRLSPTQKPKMPGTTHTGNAYPSDELSHSLNVSPRRNPGANHMSVHQDVLTSPDAMAAAISPSTYCHQGTLSTGASHLLRCGGRSVLSCVSVAVSALS